MQRLTHGLVLIALTITGLGSQAVAQKTLWGMQRGDFFRVQTKIDRQTTVQLDDDAETTTRITDTLIFEYRVQGVLASGDIGVQVRVVGGDRQVDGKTDSSARRKANLLKSLMVLMTVDPTGVVTKVLDHQNALRRMLDAHQASHGFGVEGITEDVFRSWISHPFFVGGSPETFKTQKSQERIHDASLGLMGRVHTIATCETGKTEGPLTSLKISGNPRHFPADSAMLQAPHDVIRFSDVKVTVDSFEGEAHVALPQESPPDSESESENTPATNPAAQPPQKKQRPLFEDMTLQFSLSGEATVIINGNEKKIAFRQQQTQTSKLLPGYRVGQNSLHQLFIQPSR